MCLLVKNKKNTNKISSIKFKKYHVIIIKILQLLLSLPKKKYNLTADASLVFTINNYLNILIPGNYKYNLRSKKKFFDWKKNRIFDEIPRQKKNTTVFISIFNLMLPQNISKFIKFRAKRKKFVLKLRKAQIEKQKLFNMTTTMKRKLIKRIKKKILKNRRRNNRRRKRKLYKRFFFKKQGLIRKKGYLSHIYKYKRKKQ